MHLVVVSPNGELYNNEVYLVQVPGTKGSFEILNNHAPIISTLESGVIRIIASDGKLDLINIKSGFIHVKDNFIKILVQQ